MKFKSLVFTSVIVAALPAFALTPAQSVGAKQLWMTGSSSPMSSVFQSAMTLCRGVSYSNGQKPTPVTITNPGVLDVHLYLENSGSNSIEPGRGAGDRVAYSCTIQTADGRAGALQNQRVVIYHTAEGGSFNAYAPALRKAGIANPLLPSALRRITEVTDLGTGAECAAGAPVGTTVSISGVNNVLPTYKGCKLTTVILATPSSVATVNVSGDAAPTQSIGGFSDTEFVINRTNLGMLESLGDLGVGEEVRTNVAQAFGIGASYPLYFQLQQNDIGSGTLVGTCNNGYNGTTVLQPNLSAVCQPSLPGFTFTALANVATMGGISPATFGGSASGQMRYARRSGTQSAANIRFLNAPCASGDAGGAVTATRAGDNTPTVLVSEHAGTGGIKTTLNAATGAGQFGLGIVSMENTPTPVLTGTTADRWAFIKLDAVSPNSDSMQRANAIAGNYTFWYELAAFTASVGGVPPEGADLMAGIIASIQDANRTNLKGIFVTPVSGADPANFHNATKFFRGGNSCTQAVQ